jgi:hypothetical protein
VSDPEVPIDDFDPEVPLGDDEAEPIEENVSFDEERRVGGDLDDDELVADDEG